MSLKDALQPLKREMQKTGIQKRDENAAKFIRRDKMEYLDAYVDLGKLTDSEYTLLADIINFSLNRYKNNKMSSTQMISFGDLLKKQSFKNLFKSTTALWVELNAINTKYPYFYISLENITLTPDMFISISQTNEIPEIPAWVRNGIAGLLTIM